MKVRVAAFALGMLGSGCATYKDAVARAELAFEQTEYDRTIAILRDLERDYARLGADDRARYAYLRGMADLRTGRRVHARHWLALARAEAAKASGEGAPGLPPDWAERLDEALAELDDVVMDEGIAALARPARPPEDVEMPKTRRRRGLPPRP